MLVAAAALVVAVACGSVWQARQRQNFHVHVCMPKVSSFGVAGGCSHAAVIIASVAAAAAAAAAAVVKLSASCWLTAPTLRLLMLTAILP
jgi:hypothetical protein